MTSLLKPDLQRLRKKAGYRSANAYADHMGIKRATYTSYEQGTRPISLWQAWEFADDLGCSIDDIVGRESRETYAEDPYESELVRCYRGSSGNGKANILVNARGQYALSKNDAEGGIHEAGMRTA